MYSQQTLEWVDQHALFVAMCVYCTAQGEDDGDAAARRLRVLRQLRAYNDPQLWRHVSHLVLGEGGKLDLDTVIKTTEAVETLFWFLMSSAANDVRVLQ